MSVDWRGGGHVLGWNPHLNLSLVHPPVRGAALNTHWWQCFDRNSMLMSDKISVAPIQWSLLFFCFFFKHFFSPNQMRTVAIWQEMGEDGGPDMQLTLALWNQPSLNCTCWHQKKLLIQKFRNHNDRSLAAWYSLVLKLLINFFVVPQVFERILFIWAIRHPASGYVQGINDLVTPFFVVFLSEFVSKSPEGEFLHTLASPGLRASFMCLYLTVSDKPHVQMSPSVWVRRVRVIQCRVSLQRRTWRTLMWRRCLWKPRGTSRPIASGAWASCWMEYRSAWTQKPISLNVKQ